MNKLNDPISFFKINKKKLVCIDEIQRRPDLFPTLRSIIDESGRNGQILILGSASRDLIKQSSETLAGRISYIELSPFLIGEITKNKNEDALYKYWLRGGFPRSYLSENENTSLQWRYDFIRTYLERDIPQLGFNIPAQSIKRLWQMCAHSHGQLLNSSKLGESLGISNHTVRRYIDILEQSFLMRVIQPCEINLKKRIIKSPKIFIRDQGILHALLDIGSMNDLLGHPVYGSSWEGMVLEELINYFSDWRSSFYRSSSGNEIDLILERGRKRIAIECKASSSPDITKGFWTALDDLGIKKSFYYCSSGFNISSKRKYHGLQPF